MTDYTYVISRAFAGSGRVVWRWSVQCPGDRIVAHGTSITTEEAAKADAVAAMDRLARQRQHRWSLSLPLSTAFVNWATLAERDQKRTRPGHARLAGVKPLPQVWRVVASGNLDAVPCISCVDQAQQHITGPELVNQIEPAGRSIRLISERLAWLGGRSAASTSSALRRGFLPQPTTRLARM
jgi:hypothetical protein